MLSLLGAVHLAALPLYRNMPVSIISLFVLLSLWQLYIITRRKNNPSRVVQFLVIVLSFLVIMNTYGHLLGQQPGIAMIISMTLLKLFETQQQRDAYIIIYSSFFIIASNFFSSQSIGLILYVFFVVLFLLSILIALSDRRGTTSLSTRLRLSARFVLYAIPFMLVLFVLFPRIPGPLWGLPADAFSAKTGLGEQMSPGSINQLITSSDIAFRVKFDGEIPSHAQRYWRGAVLSLYDGRTWYRDDAPSRTQPNIEYPATLKADGATPSDEFGYTVTLEPTNLQWLLALEYTTSSPPPYRFTREAMLLSPAKISNVTNYSLRAQASAINRSLFAQEDLKYRLLPVDMNRQTVALASQLLIAAGFDGRTYIESVLNYFTANDFHYTLSPDRLGVQAMDDFLFNTRRGFCEHYASAFVYLMRAAGLPARVVIGYQGGKMNPLGDYMIVRQSDAHAWAEVWLDQRWQRVDPTAAVSPDRIENGVSRAGLDQTRLPMLLVTDSAVIKNIAFMVDRFQNNWNQWVVGFDEKKQMSFMKALGFDRPGTSDLILLLTTCITLIAGIIGWLVINQQSRHRDLVQHHYNLFCNKLASAGWHRRTNEGPQDFEDRIVASKSLTKPGQNQLVTIFRIYRSLHYGEHGDEKHFRTFVKMVKNLRVRSIRKKG